MDGDPINFSYFKFERDIYLHWVVTPFILIIWSSGRYTVQVHWVVISFNSIYYVLFFGRIPLCAVTPYCFIAYFVFYSLEDISIYLLRCPCLTWFSWSVFILNQSRTHWCMVVANDAVILNGKSRLKKKTKRHLVSAAQTKFYSFRQLCLLYNFILISWGLAARQHANAWR